MKNIGNTIAYIHFVYFLSTLHNDCVQTHNINLQMCFDNMENFKQNLCVLYEGWADMGNHG